MKQILFILLAVFTLASCSKDDGGGDKAPLVLTGGTTTTQTVYADQTSGSGSGIKFAASAPWTANVTASKAGGSDLDWLTLNAYSGGAGEQTLTMTLKENLTGADRKAQISIVCGGTTITITVEQKGVTENGEKPEEPVVAAKYITPEGKITGGEIFGKNLPTELTWIMMRMDDVNVDYDSPTSYPYVGQNFDITLPTPTAELLGDFVDKSTDTKDFTIAPSDVKFSIAKLDYDGGSISLTNISWQDKNNPSYKMKKGDGYVEFVYSSKVATINGTLIGEDDFDRKHTFNFNNCTLRQGWNEMVMTAAEDATADGSVVINVTMNNAPSTFKWIAQSYTVETVLRLVSKIERTGEGAEILTFLYDPQGRMISAKETLAGVPEANFLDKYTWEYNGNTIVCKQTFVDKAGSQSYTSNATETLSLNDDGAVKSIVGKSTKTFNGTVSNVYDFTETYTYNDGFLIQHNEKGNVVSENGNNYVEDLERVITWKDGNIIREDEGRSWNAKYEYRNIYDKRGNIDISYITREWGDMPIIPLNLGRRPQGLISKMTEYSAVTIDGELVGTEYVSNYTYEYDNMGFVVKINETTDDGSQNTTTITYVD